MVPPVMETRNCWAVTTFTETVEGEMVTLIFVTGSIQVDVDVEVELVVVLVVQVTAVLVVDAEWQEAKPNRAASETRNRRRFTAPLCSPFEIHKTCSSASTLIPEMISNIYLAPAFIGARS